MRYQPNCPMLAALCAWTALQHGHHVAIEIREIEKGTDHAQAIILDGDKTIYLTELWDSAEGHLWVTDYQPHYPDAPIKEVVSLQNWCVLQIAYLEELRDTK